jgi:ABC-type dipeptide/oligopeptide/nickel transport system permease component
VIRAVLERLLASVGVVVGAVTLIFLILNWLPGDPAVLVAGDDASPETVERVRVQLGTTRPVAQQYWNYVVGLVHGDLGKSYVTHEPVLHRLAAQLPSTASLALGASVVAVVLGIGAGVLAALHQGRWLDQIIQSSAFGVVSIPPFWLGILMMLLFSVKLRWLPILGTGGVLAGVLPVACLGLVTSVPLLRMVRDGILHARHEPYVTTLRAMGLGERRVLYVHVLRNALMATVTLLSVLVGELLSGAVIVETLFARQGIGRITVEAINQKDMPVVQGAVLLASVSYVLVNVLVDISYTLIDPRTRFDRRQGLR